MASLCSLLGMAVQIELDFPTKPRSQEVTTSPVLTPVLLAQIIQTRKSTACLTGPQSAQAGRGAGAVVAPPVCAHSDCNNRVASTCFD